MNNATFDSMNSLDLSKNNASETQDNNPPSLSSENLLKAKGSIERADETMTMTVSPETQKLRKFVLDWANAVMDGGENLLKRRSETHNAVLNVLENHEKAESDEVKRLPEDVLEAVEGMWTGEPATLINNENGDILELNKTKSGDYKLVISTQNLELKVWITERGEVLEFPVVAMFQEETAGKVMKVLGEQKAVMGPRERVSSSPETADRVEKFLRGFAM